MDESRHDITWNNSVSLGVDNTSVNVDCRNLIKTTVLQKNCHLRHGLWLPIFHNTAGKAAKAFEEIKDMYVVT